MDSDYFYESFFFCSRDDLEGLQLVHKSLRNTIVAGSKVLPLRPIRLVCMGYDKDARDKIRIFVEEPAAGDAPKPDYEASIDDGAFAETFHRLQNTCIKEFNVGIRGSPFLRCWKTEKTAAFTVVNIRFDYPETMDYAVLDSIVNHVRPRTTQVHVDSWHENSYSSKLLARDSLLNNLRTCRLLVWTGDLAPSRFILQAPGYPNYELRYHGSYAADGIDGFIESFVRDGCTNEKLESVCIQWDDPGTKQSPKPQQLSKPTKVEAPLPKNDTVARLTWVVHRVSQCEKYSFVNTQQRKRMDVYKWGIESNRWDGRHTAHVLQVPREERLK